MKKLFAATLAAAVLVLTGCASNVVTKVADPLITRDLNSFVALANQFGTDAEKACAAYLQGAWADKAELAAIDADGLLANAYKIMLLSRHINQNESLFKEKCGSMAGEILIEVGRQLRK